MKIANVQAIVLDSGLDYGAPESGEESTGVRQCLLIKVSTDEGITGWSDVETAPQVCAPAVESPATGSGMFEGLRQLALGEYPFDVERLWARITPGQMMGKCRADEGQPCRTDVRLRFEHQRRYGRINFRMFSLRAASMGVRPFLSVDRGFAPLLRRRQTMRS